MPKTNLDGMGRHNDINFRVKAARKYLAEKVKQARNVIYGLGQAVAGTGVDNLLKSTSSVPTIVSAVLFDHLMVFDGIYCRTHFMNALETSLISRG
jgi:hypothetical protein